MIDEYLIILERGKRKKTAIQKKLRELKKQRRINLDDMFSEEHEKAFQVVDCLKCAHCCAALGPRITERDIDRLAKTTRMKPGQVAEAWLRIDEDGDYIYRDMPCPFLGRDNYCLYYDARPEACRRYPYTDQRNIKGNWGNLIRDMAVCPAVVLVLEGITAL